MVFEFTSPLTPYGSSTSGHAGSGDRYLFPEYTILEWLPGGNTVLASFLLVRKVDPNMPFPLETATEVANSRAKGKSTPKSKKPDKKKKTADYDNKEKINQPPEAPTGPEPKPAAATEATPNEQDDKKEQPNATSEVKRDSTADNPTEAKKEPVLKEYYQPVTFRIQSPNPKVLEPLARVVKPPEEVRKYMNDIMDRAERAPDGFLAMRLPRENVDLDRREHEDSKKGVGGVSVGGTRSRSSRAAKAAVVEQEDVDLGNDEGEEEEEELKEFYGAPTGLGFW